MAMFQPDADGADPPCDPLSDVVDLIQAPALCCQSPGDLVDQDYAGEAPATDHPALRLAHRDVVADDDELNLVRLSSVLRSVLFGRETEIEDVAGIVPVSFISVSNCHTTGGDILDKNQCSERVMRTSRK